MKYAIIEKGETRLSPIEIEVQGVHGHVQIKHQSGDAIDDFIMRGEYLNISANNFNDVVTESLTTKLVITDKDKAEVVFDKSYKYCATSPGIIFDCFDRVIKIYMGDATSVPTMPPFANGSPDYGFSVTVCEYVFNVLPFSDIITLREFRINLSLYSSLVFRDRDYYQNKTFQHVPKWDILGIDENGEENILSSGCNEIGHGAYLAYTEFCKRMYETPEPRKPAREYRKEYNLK